MEALKTWNKEDTTNKTYANFKAHLRKEYNELRQVGALSIKDAKIQPQMNLTSSSDMTERISATVTNDLRTTIMDAIMALNNSEDTIEPQVNAATIPNDTNVTELARLVKDLHQEVKFLRSQGSNGQSTAPSTSRDVNPKTGKPWRRYCHTHGCCNHWGRHCKDKAPGHKDEATFRNRMGGSNFNCLPVQE